VVVDLVAISKVVGTVAVLQVETAAAGRQADIEVADLLVRIVVEDRQADITVAVLGVDITVGIGADSIIVIIGVGVVGGIRVSRSLTTTHRHRTTITMAITPRTIITTILRR